MEVRDLVWLIEDNVQRSQHRMARIVEIYPGKDGVVRSALIKTLDGTLKRPVVKLAPFFNERFPSENGAGIVGDSNIFRVSSRQPKLSSRDFTRRKSQLEVYQSLF